VRTFSIITTSMDRLDHLKATLPRMVAQPAAEVIVVDYSCPAGTAKYVRKHFPSVKIVSVEGESHYSNWRARNAGVAAASSDVLLFCDADTVLADNAIAWIADNLPDKAYGFFKREVSVQFAKSGTRLSTNQLKGFHVVPSGMFRRIGGYDEVLEGYAAGGDTDLEDRMLNMGMVRFAMDPAIIESIIEHDNAARIKHHRHPVATSYCTGILYRAAKLALLRLGRRLELPLDVRRRLYQTALEVAGKLGSPRKSVSMTVTVDHRALGMPRQLGYRKAMQKLSVTVEVSVEGELAAIPE
jgi:glycosyltransferase involved in cell wall biosynthesis